MGKSDSKEEKEVTLHDKGYYLLMEDIHDESCAKAIDFILWHNLQPSRVPAIQLMINSRGGSVTACMALIDIMKGSKIPVYTVGLGLVSSCGLLLFMSGKKGHRMLTPNTSILSHQFSWSTEGKEHELFATVREFELMSKRLISHYRKCTGLTEKQVREVLLPPSDRWLTSEEAVEFGIADTIKATY